jgi:hypothetical protein
MEPQEPNRNRAAARIRIKAWELALTNKSTNPVMVAVMEMIKRGIFSARGFMNFLSIGYLPVWGKCGINH